MLNGLLARFELNDLVAADRLVVIDQIQALMLKLTEIGEVWCCTGSRKNHPCHAVPHIDLLWVIHK